MKKYITDEIIEKEMIKRGFPTNDDEKLSDEEFVQKAVKKSDARPFKVPDEIILMVVDPNTGNKAKFSSKNTIIESYKSKNVSDGKILYSNNNRLDTNNILRFY